MAKKLNVEFQNGAANLSHVFVIGCFDLIALLLQQLLLVKLVRDLVL